MMTWQAMFVFVLLLVTFGAMVWEKMSVDLVAMLALGVLLAVGILTPREAFRVFGNEAVVTVAAMFVLSAALERTGTIELIGHRLNRMVGESDWSILLIVLPIVALISAFVNNTPVVLVFMPITISLAVRRNVRPSKLLIPLSFASIFGGCCTLIGSSTNIIVSTTARHLNQPPLGMFELTKIGGILVICGIVYLLTLGRRFLPERETLASLLQSTDAKQYLTEAVIAKKSPLIGRRIADTALSQLPRSRVLEVIRGGETLVGPYKELVLEQGDRLRLTTVLSSVMEIKGLEGIEFLPQAELGLELVGTQKAVVAESVIGPKSSLIGQSIRDVNFRRRYGVLVLALHRQGENLRENFENVQLEYGDTLLLEGTEMAMNRLRRNRDFLVLVDVPQSAPRRAKQGLAIGIVGLVVVLAALNAMPIGALAVLGAVLVVVTGCLEMEEAYEAIEWKVLFLLFGMLALGAAMEKTQGAQWIAERLVHGLGAWGPEAVLSLVFLGASVLTSILSNNAVAVLLTPIAIQAAAGMHVEARPFLIAVAIGSSVCFATPIGYQTNTLVYGAGGYLFRDFIKVGVPLNLLFWIIAMWLIPVFWPFQGLPGKTARAPRAISSKIDHFPRFREERVPIFRGEAPEREVDFDRRLERLGGRLDVF